jgi:acyl-coenzyme A thioesterase PaaI-like protein
LNSYTSSNTSTTALNAFTQSAQTRFTEIGVVSGSLISSASAAKTTNDTQDGRLTTLEGTGTIQGVGTSNNVTFAKVTTTGDVVVGGDLVVQGNTVTLNTATLIVEDKLITLASGSTSSATADGGGIEIAGAGANFIYQHSTTAFTSSVALIAPAVTSSINLGAGAGSSKRIAFRNTNGNLDLVATGSINGDLLQWDGTDFIMSNIIDGGSF